MTLIPIKRSEPPKATLKSTFPSTFTNLPHRPSPAVLSPASATATESTLTSSPISSASSNLAASSKTPLRSPESVSTPLNLPTSTLPRHILTRRRRYLEKTPSYFTSASADAELSNPLEYDRLIRCFQSAAEREREGKKKGWASTLEAGLLRGEARSAEAKISLRPDTSDTEHRSEIVKNTMDGNTQVDWSISDSPETEEVSTDTQVRQDGSLGSTADLDYLREKIAESESLNDQASKSQPTASALLEAHRTQEKRRGEERWRAIMADRFVSGKDENFDYRMVDENEQLDEDWAARKAEEDWFEEEEAMIDGLAKGETGLQDF